MAVGSYRVNLGPFAVALSHTIVRSKPADVSIDGQELLEAGQTTLLTMVQTICLDCNALLASIGIVTHSTQ